MMLPEEEVNEEELKRIGEVEAEIEREEYVTLKELIKRMVNRWLKIYKSSVPGGMGKC
ncbi:MAG: hypothetical protein FGF51_06330 [Candidatus Brockarchaeota archaeon]|nr:hypothetical protein [Candidatus Brockarchaeota archaeon]